MTNSDTTILPTLQNIVDRFKGYLKNSKNLNLENITFVCVQHLLFTTVGLIKALILLGAKPSNIHIMGKIYSTCPEVIRQLTEMGVVYYPSTEPRQLGCFNSYFNNDVINMWNNIATTMVDAKSDTIIILDDGSKCITNIPEALINNYRVFAVEQTSSGITHIKKNNSILPVVNVAYSAVKQTLESPMIAKAVIKKLDRVLSRSVKNLTCGVVGLGVIGKAIIQRLLSLNCKVVVYDKFGDKYDLMGNVKIANNIQSLFEESEYIFGCTGEDITISLDINKIQGTKNLISCSSQDVEFQSLLQVIQSKSLITIHDVLEDVKYSTNNAIFNIFRGGYPINLDNSGESVPARDIQLTRGLLLGGVLQAILHLDQNANQKPKQYMLNPKIQKSIVNELVTNQKYQFPDELPVINFLDEEWIKNNSGGEYVSNNIISQYFS